MQHITIGLMRSELLVQKFTHTVLCETVRYNVRFVVSDVPVFVGRRDGGNYYNCCLLLLLPQKVG